MTETVIVEVRSGPILKAATGLLRTVDRTLELVPDSHADERDYLRSIAESFVDVLKRELKVIGNIEPNGADPDDGR